MAKYYEVKDGMGIIPEGTTKVETGAFENRSDLKSIVIPNSVTIIGQDAFRGCKSLKDVVIPDSVTEIWGGAFFNCPALTHIEIPNSVTKIASSAFSRTGLTSIDIPKSVESIGSYAFSHTPLEKIVFPNSVTEIGAGVVADCKALSCLIVEEGNPKYDSREGCNAIIETETDKLIAACSSTIIPDSVKEIGEKAFMNCNTLTELSLPDSVVIIGDEAFRNCSSLTSITISKSVTEIGSDAFLGCSAVESIVVEEGNTRYDSRNNCNAIIDKYYTGSADLVQGCKNSTIPEGVTSIKGKAFMGCRLTSIVIPKTVEFFARGAFLYCNELASIVVEEGNERYDSRNNCNGIVETEENSLIIGCKTTIIPDTVTMISDWAFEGCEELSNITIPESVTEIGRGAFARSGLTSIVIPKPVKKIGPYAFDGCIKMQSVEILGPVNKIDEYAFSSCQALETITLGTGIKKFEESAFWYASSLKAIYVPVKKAAYYEERIWSRLCHLIVELPAEKAKNKNPR
jgi:hypothetical protein